MREPDPPVLAVSALDDFVAEVVQRARAQQLKVPARLFDWAAGEGTRLVERLVARRAIAQVPPAASRDLELALRCGVRYWAAPWVVALFPELRGLFPELTVQSFGAGLHVLLRTGGWRCAGGDACAWRLCEPLVAGGAALSSPR